MKRTLFVSLLLIILPAMNDREAKGWGSVGTARGWGSFGHLGGRFVGFPGSGHFASGYSIHGTTRPWFRSGPVFRNSRFRYPGFGFGYYAPFYGGYFFSAGYGVSFQPPSEYYDENEFLFYPFAPFTAQPNPKTNCKDGLIVERHGSSLESAIRAAFQQQCENAHPTGETTALKHPVE